MHGVLDYTTSAAVAAAPMLFDFPPPARRLFTTLAGGYTTLAGVTDYPLSLRRAVPFRMHGAAELAIAAALPVLPWALHFEGHRAARNLCFGLTALTLVVAALTDWDGERRAAPAGGRSRRRSLQLASGVAPDGSRGLPSSNG